MSRRVKEGPHHLLRGVFFGAVVAAIVPAGVDAEPSAQRLFDVTAEAGIDFVHTNGASPEKRLPETFGSGVAFLDVDGDGRQDLYFVNSGHVVNGRQGADNRLYRAVGDGKFQTVPGAAGATGDTYGMGVLAGDPDNDGDADIYLTAWGADQYYRNDGDGGFVDMTRQAGLGNSRWGSSAAYLDYDSDGDLDLFVTNYVHFDVATHPWCGRRDMDMRPAFKVSSSAYALLLASVIFAMGSTILLSGRLSARFAAVSLGTSNLRTRPLRTVLTVTTITSSQLRYRRSHRSRHIRSLTRFPSIPSRRMRALCYATQPGGGRSCRCWITCGPGESSHAPGTIPGRSVSGRLSISSAPRRDDGTGISPMQLMGASPGESARPRPGAGGLEEPVVWCRR